MCVYIYIYMYIFAFIHLFNPIYVFSQLFVHVYAGMYAQYSLLWLPRSRRSRNSLCLFASLHNMCINKCTYIGMYIHVYTHILYMSVNVCFCCRCFEPNRPGCHHDWPEAPGLEGWDGLGFSVRMGHTWQAVDRTSDMQSLGCAGCGNPRKHMGSA